jgi:hypothetical protein
MSTVSVCSRCDKKTPERRYVVCNYKQDYIGLVKVCPACYTGCIDEWKELSFAEWFELRAKVATSPPSFDIVAQIEELRRVTRAQADMHTQMAEILDKRINELVGPSTPTK